ncbi:MAG TPA: AMP-binding protein, partial [Edaphobacter sp.]
MFDLRTVNDVFVRATGRGDQVVMMEQASVTQWVPITSTALYGRVRALVEAFRGWGIQRGDRIALISENRWEWQVTDFAALVMGCVDVPLYLTLTPEQLGYMLRDSGAKVAVVSSREIYEKIIAAGELPELEHVVVMDKGDFSGAESFADLMKPAKQLEEKSPEFDAMVQETKPEDLATIIYTSGTTGEPKGVMLIHGNLASNLNLSTGPLGLGDKDVSVSFLPLSHVTARHLDYALLCHG